MATRTRKKLPHGLYQKNFPRSVRWAVDQDYGAQLTPEEKLWLSDFNDKHYGAKFVKAVSETGEWSTEERRASYIRKNTANSDAYTKCPEDQIGELNHDTLAAAWGDTAERSSGPDANAQHIPTQVQNKHAEPVSGPKDFSESPDYLNSAEYKNARDEYREHLTKTRREIAPVVTRKLKKAARKLAVVVPSPTDTYTNNEEN